MTEWLFTSVRTLHILVAALWLGAAVFLTAFLMPVIRQGGPAGGQMMVGLTRRRLHPFMATVAGLTVLTGLWLYWEFSAGLNTGVISSRPGIAFGLGGLSGLIAAIIGGAVIGRATKQIVELSGQTAGMPDGPERAAHQQSISRLQQRTALASKIAVALIIVALLLMTTGHYV